MMYTPKAELAMDSPRLEANIGAAAGASALPATMWLWRQVVLLGRPFISQIPGKVQRVDRLQATSHANPPQ